MARIRKTDEREAGAGRTLWKIGKYVRLSREDGNEVSESVVNQSKILDDEIPAFFADGTYEITDTYIDDGTSGTTDTEREAFQRMVRDMKSGRINCVVVKNLSRAFRNSANQGHFLEEFIPLYNTRFISLYQPRIDTFLDPEIVHSLEVSITGFLNEQYAYKTSADVRRTFRHKREKGEFIGAFAPYGYAKDPSNKNALIVDGDAARVVRDIFTWFVSDGMSKAGIARRLNALGVPNPTEYKRSKGLRYQNPHAAQNDGLWNPTTVTRILQDPLYIGVMRQGRQKVVSYKVHKRAAVPARDWAVVEDAVPPVIGRELFQAAQTLHRRDTRTAPGQSAVHLFAGFLRCADCQKGMTRRTSKGRVYYACRTYREKSRTRCDSHSIRLDDLEQAVLAAIQAQLALSAPLSALIEEIHAAPAEQSETARRDALLRQKRKELDRVSDLLDNLYTDWRSGELAEDQYRRIKPRLEVRAARLRETVERLEREPAGGAGPVEDPCLTAFLESGNVRSLSRGLLVSLVHMIRVHADGGLEIEFQYADPFLRIAETEMR